MKLNEIAEIVAKIKASMERNSSNIAKRTYETFFASIDMLDRRNFEKLNSLAWEFKRNNIAFWHNNEEIKDLAVFNFGQKITFKWAGYTQLQINAQQIVAEIITAMKKNGSNTTTINVEDLLAKIGAAHRKDLKVLLPLEAELRDNNITLWRGEEKLNNLTVSNPNEIITFKSEIIAANLPIISTTPIIHTSPTLNTSPNIITPTTNTKTIQYAHAGTINIAPAQSNIKLYEHQIEAINQLNQQIILPNSNHFAGLLVLPTGGGKTLTAAYWICNNYLAKGKKVLWIAHRHELLDQAKHTFADKLAFTDIFKDKKSFNYRLISGIHDKPINIKATDDLIIASKDSLNAGFNHVFNNWIKNNTDEIFLVVDEAHHATAKTYRKLINNIQQKVPNFKMLGLTATPFRTAEKEEGLLKKVFPDDIVYKIDLKALIRLGILSEPIFEDVQTRINFIKDLSEAQIKKLNYFDIDSIGTEIAKSIAENADRNLTIVNKYLLEKDKYKQTIVFALNIDNAIALNALFNNNGIKSDYVVSSIKNMATGVTISNKDNKDKIAKFRKGETQVLINVNILTEGTDLPQVQSIFLARPTISSILLTQMVGRGLRGLKAGGTKEAYIVNFIDDWNDKVAWVNPEKLFINEALNFTDEKSKAYTKQLLRLIAISKIEEFAILTDNNIDPKKREELENLAFIARLPLGIYKFNFEEQQGDYSIDRACEILVYDNLALPYQEFFAALPIFFEQNKLTQKDKFSDGELDKYAQQIEARFFPKSSQTYAYRLQDVKNIMQYYMEEETLPAFIPLQDREKYDIDKIAAEIIDKDFGQKAAAEFIDANWANHEIEWNIFFNHNKRSFLREIDVAKQKIQYPEAYKTETKKPIEKKETRNYDKLTFAQLQEADPAYADNLRAQVFAKCTDKDGFYFCAISAYKSKSKLNFQIDHIKPMHNGGLTTLDNLQLLTREENAIKGIN